jgi:hypothetical protein
LRTCVARRLPEERHGSEKHDGHARHNSDHIWLAGF